MVQAWPTRPVLAQANLSANCQLNALLRARQAHNSTVGTSKEGPLPSSTGGVVSLSALFVKALAISLAQVPAANVVLAGDRLIRQTHCDIAFARSSLDGRVDFPSLVDAHLKAAWDITRELNTLMAVEGDPASSSLEAQLKGVNDRKPTAAIANLGRGAVSSYQTPLSPSHATVIAIPSATPRLVPPVAADLNQGALAPVQDWHSVMNLEITLGCDTRMMSGVIAADLLETFIAQLEQPEHLFAERLF
ncbi:MAG: 2-oxo acid dehydrogenase subunit E2 [Pseudomonadota bacterium]